jgi:RNA polymerase sigma-70 factor (ECF subfamily)
MSTLSIKKEDEYFAAIEFIKGTNTGYNLIYNAFYKHLYFFAVSIIKDYEDANDIAISALEACFLKHSMFSKFENIKAYLFISVRNKCIKYLRYHKRFNRLLSVYDQPIPTEEYVDARIVRAEFLRQIWEQIEKLPNQIKQVFKLSYIEGLTVKEIAKQLNTTQASVSTAKNKGTIMLRKYLKINK